MEDDLKKSDYELNRANFSVTVGLGLSSFGLGLIAIGYALPSFIPNNPHQFDFVTLRLAGLACVFWLFGLLFWIGSGFHFILHHMYRGTKPSSLFDKLLVLF